jgi:acetylornithine/succinyldiaminopimelate/putrescine aminotransferase
MGRTGEWWSEATVATDVECVTPAHSSGRVPIGVSLAHSTSPTYGKVEYLYL